MLLFVFIFIYANLNILNEKNKLVLQVANEFIESSTLKSDEVLLAQGTLRPDLIESASSLASTKADIIKTHHNDTLSVRKLRDLGQLVEPLKDFHKDEVRHILQEDIIFLNFY